MSLQTAMSEGTNLRTMKLLYKGNEDQVELLVFKILDLGRELLMIEPNASQELVLMNLSIEILDSEDNAQFTFEEILYAVRKGASGGYGKTYGKINSEVVNHWLDQLYIERTGKIEQAHELNKSKMNGSDYNRSTPNLHNKFDELIQHEVDRKVKNRMDAFYKSKDEENPEQ